ncbi:hypothetical protein M2373_003000 [Chryseobacterium sp. JUb7]|nr:hypothetical protein [Chryseobacterium sp. JUb7]
MNFLRNISDISIPNISISEVSFVSIIATTTTTTP